MVNKSNSSTHQRGNKGEQTARRFLEDFGFVFIEQNFRWRGGEIDLVMLDPAKIISELVFVEVRSAFDNSPWLRYSLGTKKKWRLVKTAHQYRQSRPQARRHPYRFDVVWIEGQSIDHWRNVML